MARGMRCVNMRRARERKYSKCLIITQNKNNGDADDFSEVEGRRKSFIRLMRYEKVHPLVCIC